jgi:DNA-binding NarL/FixJ family response regulator
LRACAEQASAGQASAGPQMIRPAPETTVRDPQAAPGVHLTQRQLEVLALLCEGLPNKLICRRLNIATGTVKVHISCILRELGVTSRLQAVVAARRCGLLGEAPVEIPTAPAAASRYAAPRDVFIAA